jgi:hypothetical protein
MEEIDMLEQSYTRIYKDFESQQNAVIKQIREQKSKTGTKLGNKVIDPIIDQIIQSLTIILTSSPRSLYIRK